MSTSPHAEALPSPRAEWPADLLDVAALRSSGWRPSPFRQFLLKVHSRCNISCDYCYVYEMADQGWRRQPTVMSSDVVEQTAVRIAEHAATHDLDEVRVILHGGEPLLAGPDFYRELASVFDRIVGTRTRVEFGMQTNGVLLDERFLDLFLEHRIRLGVSLDGGRAANDRDEVVERATACAPDLGVLSRIVPLSDRCGTGSAAQRFLTDLLEWVAHDHDDR